MFSSGILSARNVTVPKLGRISVFWSFRFRSSFERVPIERVSAIFGDTLPSLRKLNLQSGFLDICHNQEDQRNHKFSEGSKSEYTPNSFIRRNPYYLCSRIYQEEFPAAQVIKSVSSVGYQSGEISYSQSSLLPRVNVGSIFPCRFGFLSSQQFAHYQFFWPLGTVSSSSPVSYSLRKMDISTADVTASEEVPYAVKKGLKVISEAELAKHNTSRDCWMVVRGIVYDVSNFLPDHPGGPEIIVDCSGRDATQEFDDIGHSYNAKKDAVKYEIGVLEGCEATAKGAFVPRKPKKPTIPQEAPSQRSHNLLKDAASSCKNPVIVLMAGIGGLALSLMAYYYNKYWKWIN